MNHNTWNLQTNQARNTRREFLKTSAKIGATMALANFGIGTLLADENSKDTNAIPNLTLNNGVMMPIIGLGTYALREVDCQRAVKDALSVGYRLFDSAQMYNNERDLGAAINASLKNGYQREELFITTKLSSGMGYKATKKSIAESLNKLKLDYVDLLLIHSPYAQSKEMYEAMEEAYAQGKIKALGISNFDTKAYLDFIKSCQIIPAVNQVQTHVFFQREALQETMAKHGTIMQAWSPFANGNNDFFKNPTLIQIGEKYGKTPAQVGLRYLVQRGINVIPKTSKKERMIENINIFDFKLDLQDLSAIKKLDTNKSLFGWDA
ncbi:aldo/keto reductase [Helicobacter sp. MIT 05-5294]|uniref:aldo/keto reductase n=1 Tax=Helicobacter sp. MIT 05-5294 TaxID=1548150 RepID=UPI0010FE25A7|nr:aldo/keto reductase [Helicobacter sp. MIT 05-5294]TLD86173.1 aldo/keto reductase [Helicobacter sp. MIT 05-5294]